MQKNIDGRCIYKPSENRASFIKAAYEKELFVSQKIFAKFPKINFEDKFNEIGIMISYAY